MTYSAAQPFRGTVRFRQHALGSLSEAIYWAQQHWTVRELPYAIHRGGVEPDSLLGAPQMSPAFVRYLMAEAHDTVISVEQDTCRHPQLPPYEQAAGRGCPDCGGTGTREFKRERFRYPMWRALTLLKGKLGDPPPIRLVSMLIKDGWRCRGEEAPMLRALRQLHAEYETGPVGRVSWTEKSDSQQAAESAA